MDTASNGDTDLYELGRPGWVLVDTFASPRALLRHMRQRTACLASTGSLRRVAAGIALITAGLLADGTARQAQASDWGCQVLLCLSNPGGPTQYGECVPPITRLWRTLARGGGFPSCSEGGMSTGRMAQQLYRCPAGWRLKDSRSPFASSICQSMSQTHRVCDTVSHGHNGVSQEVCRDEPLERGAERNPKPNYVDVTYPDGNGGTTTQRVWFSLKH